jgi:cytochrome b
LHSTRARTRSIAQLYVDVILLVALLLLFSPRLTGLPVHEWLGMALAGVVALHLLLSWSWISASTRRFAIRTDWRARVNYLLNWLLFVLI